MKEQFLICREEELYLMKFYKMLAVKGIYDGSSVQLLEKIKNSKRYKVIITFVEELKGSREESELRDFAAQTTSLEFWNDNREDIYQDYLSKPKTKAAKK